MTRDIRERSYWDRQARSYDRSMALLGRPVPRMAQLAGEAVEGAQRVLEVAGLVVTREETLPGLIPIGYVHGEFAAAGEAGAR